MIRDSRSSILGAATLVLAGTTLSAEDFQPLMDTVHSTWPEKHHIGVICNYRVKVAQVQALARAAQEGALITVVDSRLPDEANAAANLLARHHVDFVVLLPGDPNFREGTMPTTLAVNRLALWGVPALGTTPVALKQGAVFSIGDRTGGKLLVNEKLIGTIDVNLPSQASLTQRPSLVPLGSGMATIQVHSAR